MVQGIQEGEAFGEGQKLMVCRDGAKSPYFKAHFLFRSYIENDLNNFVTQCRHVLSFPLSNILGGDHPCQAPDGTPAWSSNIDTFHLSAHPEPAPYPLLLTCTWNMVSEVAME